MNNSLALSATALTKTFDGSKALNGVSFEVKKGSIHALLGPNGAGKSTLLSICSGLMKATSGTAHVFGVEVHSHAAEVKKMIGLVPQEIVEEHVFTVYETLWHLSALHGVSLKERKPRVMHLLEAMQLTDKKDMKARMLSGGMKRRLMIAKAMLAEPKLVILDEPTAGVDVLLRQQVWQFVRGLSEKGTTVILTTHYLEEAEELADELTIINKGEVVAGGSMEALRKNLGGGRVFFELEKGSAAPAGAKSQKDGSFVMTVESSLEETLQQLLSTHGNAIKKIHTDQDTLENIFLRLTT